MVIFCFMCLLVVFDVFVQLFWQVDVWAVARSYMLLLEVLHVREYTRVGMLTGYRRALLFHLTH